MAENQSSLQELQGRSQLFMFPRRDFLQKAVSAALPFLVPRSQPVDSFFGGRPLPQFKIGDLVVEDWLDEDDENATDFGEVLGIRWLPEGHSSFAANTWVYYIYWTHSTTGSTYCYPCYDGEATEADRLRLVGHD
jgi:hypothetical protein